MPAFQAPRHARRVELTVTSCSNCEHTMQVIDDGLPRSRKARDPGHPTVGVELTVVSCCDCEHTVQVIDDGLPGSRKARDPGHPTGDTQLQGRFPTHSKTANEWGTQLSRDSD